MKPNEDNFATKRVDISHSNAESSRRRNKAITKRRPYRERNETKVDVFIQPTAKSLKEDRSVKIALDALNKTIEKDKYQKPNLENLQDMVVEQLEKEGDVL